MGIFRYFLALVVIFCHVGGASFQKPLDGNGGLAVQAFFLISGFYMALIFSKYQLGTEKFAKIKNFYFSRFLRIYPIYYITLIIMLTLYHYKLYPLYAHAPAYVLHTMLASTIQKVAYLFQNLFIFGQSIIRFFIYDPNLKSFVFHPLNDGYPDDFLGSSFTVMGQGWSLSIELTFYLLVPFLFNSSNKLILSLILASVLLRAFLQYSNFYGSQVMHAFLPLEISIFLLGLMSYRLIYLNLLVLPKRFIEAIGIFLASVIAVYSFYIYHNLVNYTFKYWLFVAMTFFAVPFFFHTTRNSKWDRFIGELSYPVYMTHFIAIAILMKIQHLNVIVTIIIATVMAIVLNYFVTKPMDYFRHKQFLINQPAKIQFSPARPLELA